MYIDLLKQYTSHLDTVKFHPATTDGEIGEAEKRLNILFPNELKNLLFEINGDNFLLWSLDQMIKENLDLRSMNPKIVEPELFDFSNFLFFATNGCGDYYGYKVENGKILSTSIFIFDHEEYVARFVAANVLQLIELYYTDQI